MQAVALALVAAVAVYTMGAYHSEPRTMRRMRRILWTLLAIYLLSPILAGAFGVLIMLMA